MAGEGTCVPRQTGGGFFDSIRSSQLGRRVEDGFDQLSASVRWSNPLGSLQRVPLSREVDDRCALAALSLGKAVYDQVCAHGSAQVFLQRPVTLLLVGTNLYFFMKPGGLELRQICLSPFCVMERNQWGRIFSAAVAHLDTSHLLSNLSATLPEAMHLEESSGSVMAAAEIISLTAASHSTYVLWAWGQKKIFGRKMEYYSIGSIGLSSLAFALQVVSNERRSALPGSRSVALGPVLVPLRFSWLLHLLISHICAPESSFPGHLCGVAAGLMYVYGVEPLLHLVGIRPRSGGWSRRWDMPSTSHTPHFYGAGTTGGRVIASRELQHPRRAWWRRWATQLGGQLLAVALAAGVYMATQRRSHTRPINTWTWSGR